VPAQRRLAGSKGAVYRPAFRVWLFALVVTRQLERFPRLENANGGA
jgi:hypothetical protein